MAATPRNKPGLSVVGQADKFNAIQKVCAILRVLAQNSPLRLTEIADATSLNKATTLRILGSLIDEGFVSRVAGAKTYELGQEARVMAISARRTVDIAELAQPSLLRLSERSADTALLSVRSGVEALLAVLQELIAERRLRHVVVDEVRHALITGGRNDNQFGKDREQRYVHTPGQAHRDTH